MRFKEYIIEISQRDLALYILDQATSHASNIKRSSGGEDAAWFYDAPRTEKIKWMNKVVFPAYKKAGSPKRYTPEMTVFIHSLFRGNMKFKGI